MIQQCVQTAVLAVKIAIERLTGNTRQVADLSNLDIGIGNIRHQFQQALFQLPLTLGAFFRVAVLVHGNPRFQKYMDIIAEFLRIVNISKLLEAEF